MNTEGIFYIRNDEKLRKNVIKAKKLIQIFNSIECDDDKSKEEILGKLLGSIGGNINIDHNFHCDLGYNIHVGDNFYASYNCTILDIAKVVIGNNCLIAPNVGIYTASHNIDPVGRHESGFGRPITIGNNVWVGGHSVILGGVKIGDNSIIAAGSVVTKDVPKNTIYGGNPAKKLKDI